MASATSELFPSDDPTAVDGNGFDVITAGRTKKSGPTACQLVSLNKAFSEYVRFSGATQSAEHIKPLHWYVACRLVLEGGFDPDHISPHPPFRRKGDNLIYAPEVANHREQTVFGGLKTKDVDVVVSLPGLGPVVAVSCKSMRGAVRNLTNRMEETLGECTNLHLTYPALVFGYLFVFKANRVGETNDLVFDAQGRVVDAVHRYHEAMCRITGRKGLHDVGSKYEAVALGLIEYDEIGGAYLNSAYPDPQSPLRFGAFFDALYRNYDERFVFGAPALAKTTQRSEWRVTADLDANLCALDYPLRRFTD